MNNIETMAMGAGRSRPTGFFFLCFVFLSVDGDQPRGARSPT
jgi:hypothetical protein